MDKLVSRMAVLAEEQPDRAAVIFKNEAVTYAELNRGIYAAAGRLKAEGIRRGDRVAYSAVSRPEAVVAYLAIQLCGAIAVPLDRQAGAEIMIRICRRAEVALLMTDKPVPTEGIECRVLSLKSTCRIPAAGEENATTIYERMTISPEDPAEILFTSGTTREPKGVVLSYRAVYHILRNTIDGVGYSSKTMLLLPLPLHHSFALRVMRAVLYSGGTIVLQNGFTFATETEKNILRFGCNAMVCVPASFEVIRSQMQDRFVPVLSRLEMLEFGAGSLTVGQRREITELLPHVRIMNVWGSSESGGAIFCDVHEAVRREETTGCLGRALDGKVDIAFLQEGTPLEQEDIIQGHLTDWMIQSDVAHPGRMAIRGEMIMSGYWKQEKLTRSTLIDGWLVTGDLGYADANGNIYMLGRADDLINMGGEKVSPAEMESIVGGYPDIRECACIGAEDPKGILGQIPVLFISVKVGFNEGEFLKWMNTRIERNRLPQKVVNLPALPRNRMKKLDRNALKIMLAKQETLSLMNPVIETILNRRSIRKFTEQEIPEDALELILQCGYHAPTGHNMQSWRFTVLKNTESIQALKNATTEAAKKDGTIVYGFDNPRVMILISNDSRNPDGCQDASCAAENIMLAARSLGIGSVWINALMTLRETEPIRSLLDGWGIPEKHRIWAAVALGYPVAEGTQIQRRTDVIQYI